MAVVVCHSCHAIFTFWMLCTNDGQPLLSFIHNWVMETKQFPLHFTVSYLLIKFACCFSNKCAQWGMQNCLHHPQHPNTTCEASSPNTPCGHLPFLQIYLATTKAWEASFPLSFLSWELEWGHGNLPDARNPEKHFYIIYQDCLHCGTMVASGKAAKENLSFCLKEPNVLCSFQRMYERNKTAVWGFGHWELM